MEFGRNPPSLLQWCLICICRFMSSSYHAKCVRKIGLSLVRLGYRQATDAVAWNLQSTGMELRKRLCAMRAKPLNGWCGSHARMVQGHRTRTIPKRQGYCCDLLGRWFYEYRGFSKAYHACCPTRTRWVQRQAKSESRRVACRSCRCASTDNVDTWLVCSSTCLLVNYKTQCVRSLFVNGIFL